jgi:hypothetical protein
MCLAGTLLLLIRSCINFCSFIIVSFWVLCNCVIPLSLFLYVSFCLCYCSIGCWLSTLIKNRWIQLNSIIIYSVLSLQASSEAHRKFFPAVNQPGRHLDYSRSSNAEVKSECSFAPALSYYFTASLAKFYYFIIISICKLHEQIKINILPLLLRSAVLERKSGLIAPTWINYES